MLSVVFYRNSKYDFSVFVVDTGEGWGESLSHQKHFPNSPWAHSTFNPSRCIGNILIKFKLATPQEATTSN